MRINTNMAAMNAWRNMTANNGNMQKSLEKLSSGYRINRAADDAAGLAVSEKMRAQIRGTNQSIKNSQDGISLLQTAEGALTEVHSMLQRMRELSVQSSTSTLQNEDRALLQEEFSQLQDEISRIGNSTKFNGQKLLDGSSGVSASQTVGTAGTVSQITGTGETKAGDYAFTAGVKAEAAALYMGNVGVNGGGATDGDYWNSLDDTFKLDQNITVNGNTYSVTTSTKLSEFLDMVNADTASTGVTAELDADVTAIKFTTVAVGSDKTVEVTTNAASADEYGIMRFTTDAATTKAALDNSTDMTLDDAGTNATMTATGGYLYSSTGNRITITSGDGQGLSFNLDKAGAATITVQSNGTLDIQTGAEADQTLGISISDMRSEALGIDTLSVSTQSDASSALSSLDSAINTVSTQRAKLGALQNRLEYTISSQSTTAENLSAAESRIRDVDMAAEMAQFTKYQILSQASTAMLSQANQSTQGVLSLLR
ncbi:MAG TPA: flagellin [Symbiobacteriaceae bacterium]|nr:flagellin [Symbiobacteriaceae bacterium]